MAEQFKYWRTDGNIYDAPGGIEILVARGEGEDNIHYIEDVERQEVLRVPFPDDFEDAVRSALNYIYRTPAGRTLLDHLTTTRMRPRISPSVGSNCVALVGTGHLKPMAMELHNLRPGAATRDAVRTMVGRHSFIVGSDIIARAIRSTPFWSLESRPERSNVAQMSWSQLFLGGHLTEYAQHLRDRVYQRVWGWDTNESYFENQLYVSARHGQPTRGPRVSRDEIQDWLIGRRDLPDRLTRQEQEHAANVTIATLFRYAAAGGGGAGGIEWRHQANYEMNRRRAPAIGLAHELIHAYYASRGENPGFHDSDPTVVMFEFLCVGLGPFENEPVTENQIRLHWPSVVNHIPRTDPQNRRIPARRVMYL